MARFRFLAPLGLALLVGLVPSASGQRPPPRDTLGAQTAGASGLYITGPFVRRYGAAGVVRIVTSSRMDAAVIDLKDATGRVHHDSAIPELQAQETGMLGDTAQFVRDLHAGGVYAIARIVCFSDPVLAVQEVDRSIQHSRRRRPTAWVSWGTGGAWLDPWDTRNHDMIIALAREAEALGFDEIQLDYIRFPVDEGIQYATYPHEEDGVRRRDMLLGLLGRIDEAVAIPLGVDVFGIQAYWEGDSSGLGQDLELWTQHVDVFSPMLYINAMRAWEVGRPDRARRLVQIGVTRLRERLGPGPIIRPFLQAFPQGSGGEFGPRFIRDQIVGAERGGADGVLFWHPGSNYGVLQRTMHGAARSLLPFEIPAERTAARSHPGG